MSESMVLYVCGGRAAVSVVEAGLGTKAGLVARAFDTPGPWSLVEFNDCRFDGVFTVNEPGVVFFGHLITDWGQVMCLVSDPGLNDGQVATAWGVVYNDGQVLPAGVFGPDGRCRESETLPAFAAAYHRLADLARRQKEAP